MADMPTDEEFSEIVAGLVVELVARLEEQGWPHAAMWPGVRLAVERVEALQRSTIATAPDRVQ